MPRKQRASKGVKLHAALAGSKGDELGSWLILLEVPNQDGEQVAVLSRMVDMWFVASFREEDDSGRGRGPKYAIPVQMKPPSVDRDGMWTLRLKTSPSDSAKVAVLSLMTHTCFMVTFDIDKKAHMR